MSTSHLLRAGGSGPVFDGNAGDVLTLLANGESKFAPSSGGGGGLPLTKEFWVDPGRTTSTEDGSAGNPFKTVQGALDQLAGAGTVLIADGDYSGETWVVTSSVSLIALGKSLTKPASISITGGGTVALQNITPDSLTQADGTLYCRGGLLALVELLSGVNVFASETEFGDITAADSASVLEFRGCTVGNLLGVEGVHADTVTAYDSHFAATLEAENVTLRACQVDGQLLAFRATLEQSTVEAADIGNTLTADTFSLHALRVGGSSTPPLLTNVSDHPSTQAVCVVPVLAGAMADVTVSGVALFLKEGDTIDVSMATSVSLPRLAGVGIVGTWVTAAGDLVLRFFGTTPGGTQLLDLNFNQNTP
jgi:hypothetical protein